MNFGTPKVHSLLEAKPGFHELIKLNEKILRSEYGHHDCRKFSDNLVLQNGFIGTRLLASGSFSALAFAVVLDAGVALDEQ